MSIRLIQLLLISFILSACLNPANDDKSNLSKAVILTTPQDINLTIDTTSKNNSKSTQIVTFTNIGKQPVTGLLIEDFKIESLPLVQINHCDKILPIGGSCEVKIKLVTNHKIASSAPLSGSTVVKYQYNDGITKQSQELKIKFKLEKWLASVFITNSSTKGLIKYVLADDDLPVIKVASDSADYYCKVDKNNPHNGYDYKALIYNPSKRTPYLYWVLYGGTTYYSVMPDVYHQKVWKTSYQQAITTQILANVYNCIGSNCINQSEGDSLAWVGLKLNKSNKIDMRTCGSNGNNWQFSDNQLSGISFAIIPVQNSHSMKMINDLSTCDMPQKIICVSI